MTSLSCDHGFLCGEATHMLRTNNVTSDQSCQRTIHHTHSIRRHHLSFMLLLLFFIFVMVMAASDVRVAVGAVLTLALGVLVCSPSLNSPRSNLQTTAEFWQILPRCLLPLGDTFFIYFSSPPLWYSLHGALAPQAIVSSVFLPCLKNQMDLQGLLSTPPFFLALWKSSISSTSFAHSPSLYEVPVFPPIVGLCC